MGAADGHLGEHDFAAAQAVAGARDHVAAVDLDLGAEALQRHDEEVDRAGADGAAAGHGDLGLAHACHQRPDHPEARPHLGDELIGRGGVDDVRRRDVQGLALIGGVAGALAVEHDVDAVIVEDALEQRDIGKARHVVEDERLFGEKARDHQGQGGVLGAGNRNGAMKRPAANDADAIHVTPTV
jgi:hypothetical protein